MPIGPVAPISVPVSPFANYEASPGYKAAADTSAVVKIGMRAASDPMYDATGVMNDVAQERLNRMPIPVQPIDPKNMILNSTR